MQIGFKSLKLFHQSLPFIIAHTVCNLTIDHLLLLLNLPALYFIFNVKLIQE